MPLAMNNTFTLNCTSGKVLHDLFPLLEDVKMGGDSAFLQEAGGWGSRVVLGIEEKMLEETEKQKGDQR